MYFNCHTNVTIAGKLLNTVVGVHSSNDFQHIGADCDVVVPLNCRISYKNPNNETVYLTDLAKNLFKAGDPILVTAWYDGYDPVTVFKGFIYDFIEGTPLTIKCLDYLYFFNMGTVGKQRVFYKKSKKAKKELTGNGIAYKSITLQALLQVVIDFVNDTIDDSTDGVDHVSLILPMFDMTLVNITFITMSPAAILEWLKKEMGLNISLTGNKLYCDLANKNTTTIKLNTSRNVIKSGLQRPLATFLRIKLKAWFIRSDGFRDSFEVGDESGTLREVYFYKVQRSQSLYENMANAALTKYRQYRYSGAVEIYLYPDCDLFQRVEYVDVRYPERTGVYTITSIDINIDNNGYHRVLKLAALTDLITGTGKAI